MADRIENKRILLIISGGIAAYKSLELIRLLKKAGANVRCILTRGGAQFITPLSVASISGEPVYEDLWSLKDETEMGHIRLSRESDLIVVAPASANMIAKMAYGLADDLAVATLLASDKPVLIAPAMNHMMWDNAATRENIAKLRARGIATIGPCEGDMACGEFGMGRMAEPEEILESVQKALSPAGRGLGEGALRNIKALVTGGPTFEPIDPVRFIGNRSSGKQAYAIAESLRDNGAKVTLISGPGALPAPAGIKIINVESAREMLKACETALPADIFIAAAAVSDWAPENFEKRKIKKGKSAPIVKLKENPDILKTISAHKKRPRLVIGFAAETENLLKNAEEKLAKKGCDWILANDAASIGADTTRVHLITRSGPEDWKKQTKQEVARRLAEKISMHFERPKIRREAAE